MSPEERAKAIYEAEEQWSDFSYADGIQTNEFKFVPFVAEHIRQVENEALEKAISAIEELWDGADLDDQCNAIRALKHKDPSHG